jgi:hypothetical protein
MKRKTAQFVIAYSSREGLGALFYKIPGGTTENEIFLVVVLVNENSQNRKEVGSPLDLIDYNQTV